MMVERTFISQMQTEWLIINTPQVLANLVIKHIEFNLLVRGGNMKREILFRGVNFQKEWVYGDLIHSYANDDIAIAYYREGSKTPTFDAVFPESVGQYTEFKDKNGKEIFEGDILEYIGKRKDNMNKVCHRKVVFLEGAFFLSVEDGVHYPVRTPIYEHNIVDWDVVGNVTDTPELMK